MADPPPVRMADEIAAAQARVAEIQAQIDELECELFGGGMKAASPSVAGSALTRSLSALYSQRAAAVAAIPWQILPVEGRGISFDELERPAQDARQRQADLVQNDPMLRAAGEFGWSID